MSPSVRNIIAWILQALLAAMFIFSGFNKLSHGPDTAKMFGSMGFPGWFAYLIGGAELLGGIGLLVPRTVRPAALGLIIIMLGAVFMHATKIPGGIAKGMPALVALVLLVVVYLLRRPETRLAHQPTRTSCRAQRSLFTAIVNLITAPVKRLRCAQRDVPLFAHAHPPARSPPRTIAVPAG
jgi:putative oxidoreductase